jgi:adenosine deaminase
VRDLIAAGVNVTINTDDPAMFNITLAGEYENVETEFGLDRQTLRRLSLNAVEASWASDAERARLQNDLQVWWSQ